MSRLVREHQTALHENPTNVEEGEGIRMTTVPSTTVETMGAEQVRRARAAAQVDLMEVAEAAATYGIPASTLQEAVDTEQLGSVTLTLADGTTLTFVKGDLVERWLS